MEKYIIAMIQSGWTVTFPQFHNKRAYAIEVTKERAKYVAGWINEQSLKDALNRLCEQTQAEDSLTKKEGDL